MSSDLAHSRSSRQAAPSYAHGASGTPLIGETIGALLRRVTAQGPGRTAQITRHQTIRWTYADLLRRSEDLAVGLQKNSASKRAIASASGRRTAANGCSPSSAARSRASSWSTSTRPIGFTNSNMR